MADTVTARKRLRASVDEQGSRVCVGCGGLIDAKDWCTACREKGSACGWAHPCRLNSNAAFCCKACRSRYHRRSSEP